MLVNSLTVLGVPLLSEQWFKRIICVYLVFELILGSFVNEPVNKIIHYVLSSLLGVLSDYSVIKQQIKEDTTC